MELNTKVVCPVYCLGLSEMQLAVRSFQLVLSCLVTHLCHEHSAPLSEEKDLYIGWSDITVTMVTKRSSFCGYEML